VGAVAFFFAKRDIDARRLEVLKEERAERKASQAILKSP
jgi:hypothetical protein